MSTAGYIGPFGSMFEVSCFPVPSISSERASTEKDTTGGVRRVQVSPSTHRTWGIDWGAATPEMAADLAALAGGEWGYGPFWLVDPWAQVVNVIPPKPSILDYVMTSGTTKGGPILLADGRRAGSHMVVSDPGSIVVVPRLNRDALPIPVQQGVPVCGSVYASGSGTVSVRLTWYDYAGNPLANTSWSNFTPGTRPTRCYRSGMPPEGAAGVMIGVRGANRIARPAVTYTSHPLWWGAGQGAPEVMLPTSFSQSVQIAQDPLRAMRYAGVSTTIREIGDA